MLPHDSNAAVPAPIAVPSPSATAPDAGFDARWAAWKLRGITHERAVRRKLTLVAGIAGALATTAAIAYALWGA